MACAGARHAHAFPPDVAVVGQRAVGEDRHSPAPCPSPSGSMLYEVPGATPKKPASGLIAYSRPSGPIFIQAMSSPMRLGLPAGDGRLEHGQVGLAAGRRERGRDVILLALGAGQAQDQHVLGHPALALRHRRGDAQREALLAQQRVAAVARAVRPDQVLLREVADVLLLHRRARPGHILLPRRERRADRVQAGNEFAVGAQRLDHLGADARHDVHVADDVRAIRDLDADLRHRRAERPHGERDDVHRAAPHAPSYSPSIVCFSSSGATQLLVGPASSLLGVLM